MKPTFPRILLVMAIFLMGAGALLMDIARESREATAGENFYRSAPDTAYRWTMEICDVRLVFQTREAMQHFRARLVAYPELGEEMAWLFDLIDAEQVEEIGPERMSEFLIEVMSGAERRWNKQYEKH